MSAYDVALSMYQREHDRWRQWALFFFAGVGATFYVSGYFHLRLWVPSLVAAGISTMWTGAGLGIRATTQAWQKTILEFETSSDSKDGAFTVFLKHRDQNKYTDDFLATLKFWRPETFLSVTRLLVLSGVGSCLIFVLLVVADLVGIVAE